MAIGHVSCAALSLPRPTVPVDSASLAIQAASGRRLVLSRVLPTGKALLYTSPMCFSDR
jgi:hypothetical protein